MVASALLLELAVRAAYTVVAARTSRVPMLYEQIYWDVPPWVRWRSVLTVDPEVGLWLAPNVRRTYVSLFGPIGDLADVERLFTAFVPRTPAWLRDRPSWTLATNSHGLRDDEFPSRKAPGALRIVVLGDSWTVGTNVDRDQTYPRRLAAALAADAPGRAVEVLNYGTIGAGIDIGRRLVARILALAPDVVVLAYAQNDEAALRTATPTVTLPPPPIRTRLVAASELWTLVRYLEARVPGSIEATVKRDILGPHLAPENAPPRGCPNPNVETSRYREALDEVVASFAAHGVDVVLLYNNVPDALSHCTLVAQEAVARARGTPLVDSSAVLAVGARLQTAQSEVRHGLRDVPASVDAAAEEVTLVFRVDMSGEPPGRTAYVMGNSTPLGRWTPNAVRLHDDGTHGDQRANDRVWSLAITMQPAPIPLVYLYTDGDESGAWHGLENYVSRTRAVGSDDVGRVVLLPIEDFGRRRLRSDAVHPDAEGYRLIARALADAIESRPAFRAGGGS